MSTDLRDLLRSEFRWTNPGPNSEYFVSDRSGWWREPRILDGLGPALADLFRSDRPTVVVSPEVTGFMLGPLVARALGVGFVEAYRAGARRPIAEPMIWTEVPADHRGDVQHLGVREWLISPADRVLIVDDWASTGAQARGLRNLVGDRYVGTAVIVDECPPAVTAELIIRSLLSGSDLDP
ncbi:adenine phosphoribosyltransferase [Actinoplanes lutulentus]|uniref:Adenine phosphoribosyltransferase n=1 Tax=Actinoplanes lutulentus TaxID=1287878 RepID=A0A327ZGV7_9ACTN|nr:phosphoribosyltransferase [Actinoplanes lutulentus]MBB2944867.1 adenine phosphoribosyltransferase [Actinoplanes lutulentus]RAK35341.1 adenine phosphoribosyltransferase [Actinoplanes lutulentus]